MTDIVPAAMDTPPRDEDAPFESLHPRARIGMRVSAGLGYLALGVAAGVAALLSLRGVGVPLTWSGALLLFAALVLAALLGGWRYGTRRWQRTRWRLDARGLEIRRGVFWQHEIRVPRSRVQHTDLHRGPLDRRWGMADLIVYTAGSENAAVRLAGLDAGRAQALRDALLQGHDEQL